MLTIRSKIEHFTTRYRPFENHRLFKCIYYVKYNSSNLYLYGIFDLRRMRTACLLFTATCMLLLTSNSLASSSGIIRSPATTDRLNNTHQQFQTLRRINNHQQTKFPTSPPLQITTEFTLAPNVNESSLYNIILYNTIGSEEDKNIKIKTHTHTHINST